MKTRKQTLLAIAVAFGLFAATPNFAPAQQRQPPPRSGPSGGSANSDDGGGGASQNQSGAQGTRRQGQSGGAGSSNQDKSQPPRSPNPAPGTYVPRPNTPPPGGLAPRTNNPAPGTMAPRPGTPAPGQYPPENARRPAPGQYAPDNANRPAPGQYVDRRKMMRDQLAQRPIVLPPVAVVNTWPWWYNIYFPTYSFFGSGVDNFSGWYDGAGGWYDDNYDETRRSDRAANTPANPEPAPAPAPAPAPGQGAAALDVDHAYRQLVADVARLQARYDDAVRKVLERLKKDNADYRELLAQRDRADERVEAVQASSKLGPDPAKVAPAAQRKLDIKSRITQMEQDAIRNDPEASAARKDLEQATAKLSAARKSAAPAR
jgi:hypothetical protein